MDKKIVLQDLREFRDRMRRRELAICGNNVFIDSPEYREKEFDTINNAIEFLEATEKKPSIIEDEAVQKVLFDIISDAMEKRDRSVSINFYKFGPSVTIYPMCDDEEEETENGD